jgi:hypothetical protein
LVGRTIRLNDTAFTVIGIMPAEFVPPEALGQRGTEAWMPLAFLDPEARSQRGNGFLQVIGKVRAGVAAQAADDELRALGDELSRDHPGPGARTFGLAPLHDETVGGAAAMLLPLLGAVAMLLAIACMNVANLLLMRANERSPELAMRTCLGAGRVRLIRQLMTEGVLLGALGGVLGVWWPLAA